MLSYLKGFFITWMQPKLNLILVMKKPVSIIVLTFNFTIICFVISAQKLPNKQESSIYAPAMVTIGGNASEWGNTLQAYNRATEISYTLANDADNLYLICRATEPEVIQKMMLSGITLTISRADKNASFAPLR